MPNIILMDKIVKDSGMEEIIKNSAELIYTLHEQISNLRDSLSGKTIPVKLQEAFKSFDNAINRYNDGIEQNLEMEKRLHLIQMVGVYGQTIAQNLNSTSYLSNVSKTLGAEILKQSQKLRDNVVNRTVIYSSEENTDIKPPKRYPNDGLNKVDDNLKSIIDDHNRHDQRIKKALNENESRISLLDASLKIAEDSVTTELEKIKKLYETTLVKLTEKEIQLDDLLSLAAGKVIASDYDKSAIDERNMADYLRWGSIAIMTVIIGIVGYTFYETTAANFKWETSIFRMSLTLLLSIPAAYLARESAKHRAQQYSHLQTALDLKAITPYLASLPEEEQHKVKITMANRIFASKDFSEVGKDSYPLNPQEIIMEFIKKVDFSKVNHSDQK